MPKSAIILIALFGALLMTASIVMALQSMDSEPDIVVVEVVLGAPVIAIAAGFSLWATARAIRSGTLKMKTAVLYHAAALCFAWSAFQVTSRCLIPADMRFDFSYPGNTGTYHMVRFYFRQNGRWVEGPSVQGWPMQVSFPDLNGDGYHDIRVAESGSNGVVEFVYLPQNDGHSFWHAIKNDSRLSAAYEAADYFSNYP